MSSHWVDLPGIGAFVHFARDPAETPDVCRALIAELLRGLSIAESDAQITASVTAKWRGFSWSAIDQAIANPAIRNVAFLVGSPSEVHLGARVALRRYPDAHTPAACSWVVAESQRFPREQMVIVCKRWLAIAATQGDPLAGGVVAAANLLNLKNEVSLERESTDEALSAANMLFSDRLDRDRPWDVAEKIRRLYPITLLGPRYSSPGNSALLRAAGAHVEEVHESLIIDAYPSVVPAWDPEYLAATIALRRLLWPLTIQNPADAPGLGLKVAFEVPTKFRPPPWDPPSDDVKKELKRETRAFDAFAKRNREAGRIVAPVAGELVVPPPKPRPARAPELTPPPKPKKKRIIHTIGDLFIMPTPRPGATKLARMRKQRAAKRAAKIASVRAPARRKK